MPRSKATSVSAYIEAAAKEAQPHLRELRVLLKQMAPSATEAIKWGSPVLEEERILFAYSAHRAHLNFMPTGSSLDPFRDELAAYKTGKDTIQIRYDQRMPKGLIRRIAKHRVQNVGAGAKWMK